MKKIIIAFPFLMIMLSCKDKSVPPHFLDVEEQIVKERTFAETELKLVFEKELEEIGIYTSATIAETEGNLVVVENKALTIRHLSKSDLTVKQSFRIQEGRGPKELEYIMTSDVSEELIGVADNQLMKIILLNHEGELENEFSTKRKPFRLNLTPSGDINLLYLHYFDDADSTFMYNLDQSGNANYEFKKENYKDMHPFAIQGEIKTLKDTLYYVGGYDPYIKKYVNGERVYSRSTIDNYDSSLNYITVISDESRSTSLSPEAIFSSRDFDVKKGAIFVIPESNGDPDFSFIDVYTAKEGNYLRSYRTIDVPDKINVYEDERSILTIEKVGELEKPVFRKYSY